MVDLGNYAHLHPMTACCTSSGYIWVSIAEEGAGPWYSTDNGANWEDAYNSLQDTLMVASWGTEIRVARGRYWPDHGAAVSPGDRICSISSGKRPNFPSLTPPSQ